MKFNARVAIAEGLVVLLELRLRDDRLAALR